LSHVAPMCTSYIESQKWLPWQRPSAPLDPHLMHDFYGPSEPTNQTASRSVQPFSHRGPQSVPILYNGTPLSPAKLPLPMGNLDSHLTHGSLGPPESSTQTASPSVQPFLQDSLVDRPTDHSTRSVTIGRIYVRRTAMRPNNTTRMCADAKRDGRLAEYRWRPLRKFRNSFPCTTPQSLADARCWSAGQ